MLINRSGISIRRSYVAIVGLIGERFVMEIKSLLSVLTLAGLAFTFACGGNSPNSVNKAGNAETPKPQTSSGESPAALPNSGFKAQIVLLDPPAKLRAGQKETIQVKIKNVSDVIWWARGSRVNTRSDNKFYIAVGNRWLKSDGSLLTNMDGRYGIGKDLKPGEETEVPLQVTAPKEAGDYILEVDLVQEQVAWFSDKGSPTAKTRITVVR